MSDHRQQERRLQELREEFAQRLEAVNRDLSQAHSNDSEEQAVERENDETLATLANEAQSEIAQIDHALNRIRSGHYGQCETCGQSIDAARLQAIPYATQCIRCAEGQLHAH